MSNQPRTVDAHDVGRVPAILWFALPIVLAWLMQLYAIWQPPYVPLVDLPNHMARFYLESLALVREPLPQGYEIDYRIVPNLGADLVMPLLMQAFDASAACKLFLSGSALMYWLGPAIFLSQYQPRREASALAAMLLLPWTLNTNLFWGFLNYYSGFGLAFAILGHYLWIERTGRKTFLQLTFHALLVALLFLWHLAPWGIYCVIVGCHAAVALADSVGRGAARRAIASIALTGLAVIPSVVLFAFYLGEKSALNPETGFDWGSWSRKLGMPLTLFRTYDVRLDVLAFLMWATAIVLGFRFREGNGWHRQWIWLAIAAFGLLYLLIPAQLGSTSATDSRLLPAILVCAAALMSRCSLARWKLALLLLVSSFALHNLSVIRAWDGLSVNLSREAEAIELLQAGSRVLPVSLVPHHSKEFPGFHFASWAVIDRHVYIPTLFSYSDQQPLRLTDRQPSAPFELNGVLHVPDRIAAEGYRYIWLYNPAGARVKIPPQYRRIFKSSDLAVYERPEN